MVLLVAGAMGLQSRYNALFGPYYSKHHLFPSFGRIGDASPFILFLGFFLVIRVGDVCSICPVGLALLSFVLF